MGPEERTDSPTGSRRGGGVPVGLGGGYSSKTKAEVCQEGRTGSPQAAGLGEWRVDSRGLGGALQ